MCEGSACTVHFWEKSENAASAELVTPFFASFGIIFHFFFSFFKKIIKRGKS